MLYYSKGTPTTSFTSEELKQAIFETFEKLGAKKKVLALPPDFTRFHSRAGEITNITYKYFGDN